MTDIAGPAAGGRPNVAAQAVRYGRMCMAEARLVVQVVFLMRFLTGVLFQLTASHMSTSQVNGSPRGALGAPAPVLGALA